MGSVSVSTYIEGGNEERDSLESNEIEKSKVGIMRVLVLREDPSSKVRQKKCFFCVCV